MDNEEVSVVEDETVDENLDDTMTNEIISSIDYDTLTDISLTLSLINQSQWFIFAGICVLIGIMLILVFLLGKGDTNV